MIMNKNVPFTWRVNYRNGNPARKSARDRAQTGSPIFAEKPPAAVTDAIPRHHVRFTPESGHVRCN